MNKQYHRSQCIKYLTIKAEAIIMLFCIRKCNSTNVEQKGITDNVLGDEVQTTVTVYVLNNGSIHCNHIKFSLLNAQF